MKISYLVTKDKDRVPGSPVIMLDGTVPGWEPRTGDFHFDHHRPGGAPIQLEEIPEDIKIPEQVTFVTTQVDADACAAAAWIQLIQLKGLTEEVRRRLTAIAYDCDHLGLPPGEKYDPYRVFARDAVASLKLLGDRLVQELGLPSDRRSWSEEQRELHSSESFRAGTEALVEASLGKAPWPGEQGEAKAYWDKVEEIRPWVEEHSTLIWGVAVLDLRESPGYVDPRLLVDWARKQRAHKNVTLSVRVREGVEGYSYTLGSVPLHPEGSPRFSDRKVWDALNDFEIEKRKTLGLPAPSSSWGGRNEVGGSGLNTPSLATPKEVVEVVLYALSSKILNAMPTPSATTDLSASPFLKWAGGKGRLIEQYRPYFPTQFQTYYEPFLGGGAIFFHLAPRICHAVLTDINPELVNVYRCIRDHVEAVIDRLVEHRQHHSKDHYYQVRAIAPESDIERAARFLYLNKTCFNGLYRENSRGEFNVPMGRYKNPRIFDPDILYAASEALKCADLDIEPFQTVLEKATSSHDFVYFDPPYHPISATSNFTGYTRYSFDAKDQMRLRDTFAELANRGVQVMLSNSDCEFVRNLYQDFRIHSISACRSINSNAKNRGRVGEVLVTSY